MTRYLLPALLASLAATNPAHSAEKYDGFLCCNMRTDGSWISDSNYAESGKRVLPAGTPVQVTGFGRYRVNLMIDGKKQSIGNDYSRDLDNAAFAKRYVTVTDPKAAIASAPAKVRGAIESARITKGMTRDQVLMALGYPISSENPNLDSNLWRFWRSSFAEFQVHFDGAGKVESVTTDPQTKNLIWVD